MKIAIVALVLAICLIQSTDAWWGGLYGLGYGWGGLYGGYGGYGGWGGYGMWGKRSGSEDSEKLLPPKNVTACTWNRNTSMIMCYGLTETVECQTQLKWAEETPKRDFSLYAIAKSETTPRSYRLLPRTLNNDAWLDSTFMNKQVSLFSSESLDHLGLRVIEEDCFNRIDNLLKMSKRNEKVYVKSKGLAENLTAMVVGDLLVVDLPSFSAEKHSKRHYGGGYRGGYRSEGYGYGGGYRGGYRSEGYGYGGGYNRYSGEGYGGGYRYGK